MVHLTKIAWNSKNGMRPWEGKVCPQSDDYLIKFINRVDEIIEIRDQNDELTRLLSDEEKSKMKIDELFDKFDDVNPFYSNEVLVDQWVSRRKTYEEQLKPLLKEIGQKLRKQIFQEVSSNPS